MIRIHDTMQRSVVPLKTRDEGRVAMYVCGPTVYNYIHIGNARTLLWFDFIRRYLRYRGFEVTYVMNYTDVDDKIIERALVEGTPPDSIGVKYTTAFEEDMRALGVEPADILCRATTHVPDMVDAIEGLVSAEVAYDAGGDVFFSIERFPEYGRLSGRSLEDERAGERVEPHEAKRGPLDFALWKAAKEGEPSWPSPWGAGRPGWHIECSVMSTRYLGAGFDIHGGGSDLIFPHHENEIAQAEALDPSTQFARHWMHAGMVQMETEKMSKSLGNFILARDVVARVGGEVARYWALAASYRSQVVFSEDALRDAAQGYERWSNFAAAAEHLLGDDMPSVDDLPVRDQEPSADDDSPIAGFIRALDDDFNSAEAFAVIHDHVREGNKLIDAVTRGDTGASDLVDVVRSFLEVTSVLGFTFSAHETRNELLGPLVEYLLELREEARREGAFERADAIRSRLVEIGFAIEDTASGSRWRVADAS